MILKNITVYQCDECSAQFSATTPAEHEAFSATWFDGLLFQFCPTCRVKPAVLSQISQELKSYEAWLEKSETTLNKYAQEENTDDVLNAQFIG
jgi:hypothetical protein